MTSTAASAAAVNAPAAAPRALPAWTYQHPEMTRLELDRILAPSWQIICHVNDIPRPGDFVTFDLGPNGVVALRDSAGAILAFHNVCRHRGARILDGTGHCPGSITCPYHGWSYRLSGELRGIPERDSFPGLERSQWSLKPVRSQVSFGFVFVCLEGDPPPVEEVWGELARELSPYHIEEMQPVGPMYLEHWQCDWKIAMDNYLESYHVPIGHPGLFRMFTPDYEDQVLLPGGVARQQLSARAAIEPLERADVPAHGGADRGGAAAGAAAALELLQHAAQLGLDIFPEQMDFFQVLPRGPGQCTIRGGSYAHPDPRREMRLLRYLGARINRQVQREDEFLCTRVQHGLGSRSYEPGPLSGLESCMLQFHELLRRRIPETRAAHAPARFA